MATKMKMVSKGGKMVPSFAADGKGKMQMGGAKKYQDGGKVTRGDIKDAQREAKQVYNISHSFISMVCTGKRTSGKYNFKYLKDYEQEKCVTINF